MVSTEIELQEAWRASRKQAETEADKDLMKPWKQLLADVHHEILLPGRSVEERIAHANKRMVSLIARAAIAQDNAARTLKWLTWALIILTVALVTLTAITLFK